MPRLVSSIVTSPELGVQPAMPVAPLMMELALRRLLVRLVMFTLDSCQHAWEVEHAQSDNFSVYEDGILERVSTEGCLDSILGAYTWVRPRLRSRLTAA